MPLATLPVTVTVTVTVTITVSIGSAHRSPAEALDQTICRADEAVYRAKFAGRNKVFIAE